MTGDGGLVLVILGAVALVTSLSARIVAQHRWLGSTIETVIDPALRAAFPPPPHTRELERLVAEAEAALQSRELSRQHRRRLRRRA